MAELTAVRPGACKLAGWSTEAQKHISTEAPPKHHLRHHLPMLTLILCILICTDYR